MARESARAVRRWSVGGGQGWGQGQGWELGMELWGLGRAAATVIEAYITAQSVARVRAAGARVTVAMARGRAGAEEVGQGGEQGQGQGQR